MNNKKEEKKKDHTILVMILCGIIVIVIMFVWYSINNTPKYYKHSIAYYAKELYINAQQQWINDSMIVVSEQVYARCNGCTYKELDFNASQGLNYYIIIEKNGNVSTLIVDDGNERFEYCDGDLRIDQIYSNKIIKSNLQSMTKCTTRN